MGKSITVAGTSRRIVGVVETIVQDRMRLEGRGGEQIYLHYEQAPRTLPRFALRTDGDPTRIAGDIRSAVWGVQPDQPIAALRTLQDHIDESLAGPKVISAFLVVVGLIALALAAMGIYGVMAHSVQQQRKEIGIRMALGANRGSVVGMVTRSGMTLVGVGVLVGLPLAAAMFYMTAVGLGIFEQGLGLLYPARPRRWAHCRGASGDGLASRPSKRRSPGHGTEGVAAPATRKENALIRQNKTYVPLRRVMAAGGPLTGGRSMEHAEVGDTQIVMSALPRLAARCRSRVPPGHAVPPCSAAQLRILRALDEVDPVMVTELASHLGVTASTASLGLKRLEERGYVVRDRDPIDRRVANVRITAEGRRVRDDAGGLDAERVYAVLQHLSPPDRRDAVRGLAAMASAADALWSGNGAEPW